MSDFSSGWDVLTAESFCSSVRDGTHDSPKFVDHGYPLVTSKNIKGGNIDLSTAALISDADFTEINRRSKVDQWDVLFSMIGTVGESCLVTTPTIEFAIKNVALFKCESEEDGRWLSLWLRSPGARSHVSERLRGSSQQYIPLGELRKLPVPVPRDKSEKRRITSVLTAYDNLIAINQRRIALLEEVARRLYREWFVHLRFPGYEAVKVVDGVPEGWTRNTMGQIAPLKYGKALKATERKDGQVPVYGSSGVVGNHDRALVDAGAIVVGRKGNVGSLYFSPEPCFPIDTVFFIDPEASTFYLLQALSNLNFISSDAAVPGLNRNYAHSLLLLVPADEVAAAFEALVAPLYSQAFLLEKQSKELAKARDALLPKLMSGQLDVSGIQLAERQPDAA